MNFCDIYVLYRIVCFKLNSIGHVIAIYIGHIEYTDRSLTWGSVLSTSAKSMWRNDIKCKNMFMFPKKKIARKGLTATAILQ